MGIEDQRPNEGHYLFLFHYDVEKRHESMKKNQLKSILFLWNWIGDILAPKFALLTKSGCHQTESPGFKCGILINLSLNKGYKRNVENKYQICPAEMSKLMYLPTKRTFKKEVSQSMLFALYFFYLKKRRWAMQNHDFQNPATQSFWGRAYLDRADFFRLGLKYLSIKNGLIMVLSRCNLGLISLFETSFYKWIYPQIQTRISDKYT